MLRGPAGCTLLPHDLGAHLAAQKLGDADRCVGGGGGVSWGFEWTGVAVVVAVMVLFVHVGSCHSPAHAAHRPSHTQTNRPPPPPTNPNHPTQKQKVQAGDAV